MGIFSRKKRDSYSLSSTYSFDDGPGSPTSTPPTPPYTPISGKQPFADDFIEPYLRPYLGRSTVKNDQNAAINRVLELYHLTADDSPLDFDFNQIGLPHAEVRALRYFVRMWDPREGSERPDDEFDKIVAKCVGEPEFQEMGLRHFYKRVAERHALEQDAKAMKKMQKKRIRDGLFETASVGAVAQLLWDIKQQEKKPERLLQTYSDKIRLIYRPAEEVDDEVDGMIDGGVKPGSAGSSR